MPVAGAAGAVAVAGAVAAGALDPVAIVASVAVVCWSGMVRTTVADHWMTNLASCYSPPVWDRKSNGLSIDQRVTARCQVESHKPSRPPWCIR